MKHRSLAPISVIFSFFCVLLVFSCKPPTGVASTPEEEDEEEQALSVSVSERILLDYGNRIRIENGLSPRALGESQITALVDQLRNQLKDANLYGDVNPVDVTLKLAQAIGSSLAAADIPAVEAESITLQTVEAVLLIISKPEFADEVLANGGSADALASSIKSAVADSIQASAGDIGLSPAQASAIAAEAQAISLSGTENVNGVLITTDSLGRTLEETYTDAPNGTASLNYDYSVSGQISVTGAVDNASAIAPNAAARLRYDSQNRVTELRLTIGNPLAGYVPFKIGAGFAFAFDYPSDSSIRCKISTFIGSFNVDTTPGYFTLTNIVKDERGRMTSANFGAVNDDGSAIDDIPEITVRVSYGGAVSGKRYGVSKLMKLVLGSLFDDSIQEATITGSMAMDGETASLATTFDSLGDVSMTATNSLSADTSSYAISLRTLSITAQSSYEGTPSTHTLEFNPAATAGASSTFIMRTQENGVDQYAEEIVFDGDLKTSSTIHTDYEPYSSTTSNYSYGVAYDGKTWDCISSSSDGSRSSGGIYDPSTGMEIESFYHFESSTSRNDDRTERTYDAQCRVATEHGFRSYQSLNAGTVSSGDKTVNDIDSFEYGDGYTKRTGIVEKYTWSVDTSDWILDRRSNGSFDGWDDTPTTGTVTYFNATPYIQYLNGPIQISSATVSSTFFASHPQQQKTRTMVYLDVNGLTVATVIDTKEFKQDGMNQTFRTYSTETLLPVSQTMWVDVNGGTEVSYNRVIQMPSYDPASLWSTIGQVTRFYSASTLVATYTYNYADMGPGIWTLP